jgi:putative hydrolases of HD superfamily
MPIPKKDLDGLVEFIRIAEVLKKVDREGWKTQLGLMHPESVADHSFATAVLAMSIADLKKKAGQNLDAAKVMRMALLHDLHETVMGDWDFERKREMGMEEFERQEKESIDKILKAAPEGVREEYSNLLKEFAIGESDESKLVRQIDKLELTFQTLEYESDFKDRKDFLEWLDHSKSKMKDEDMAMIMNILLGS